MIMRSKLLPVLLCCAAWCSPLTAQHRYSSYGAGSRVSPGGTRHAGLTSTRLHSGKRSDLSGAHQRGHALHLSKPPSARTSPGAQGVYPSGASSSMGPRQNFNSRLNMSSAPKTGSFAAGPQGPTLARSSRPQVTDHDDHSSPTDQKLQNELSRRSGPEHRSQSNMSRSSTIPHANMGKGSNSSHPSMNGNRRSGQQ